MSTETYQIGGCLPPDASSYVVRSADEDLYKLLLAGEFCYVLNSRQMGKSSLRVQTMKRLQTEGVACASVDLTELGIQQVTPEKWYGGLTKTLISRFGLQEKFSFRSWLNEHRDIPPVQIFREFIEEVLLTKIAQPIVIFIDEIDSVLQLGFKDDFFALIRACYNKRAENPIYKRLSFVLLGVATPGDLIADKDRTPFNIGRAVELHGFQLEEVEPLARGLKKYLSNPQIVLKEILDWTGGQPFLTQKLCKLVCDYGSAIPTGAENKWIEKLVRSHFIDNWEATDEPEHLKTIRDRILSNEQRAAYLLELYQQVWQQGKVVANNSFEEGKLLLSGLVVKRRVGTSPFIEVYNRIYREVFNQDWIEQELAALRPYSEAFRAWVMSGCEDESWLLRGKALKDAQVWAKGKNLSYLDQQFLAAGEKREIEEQIAQRKRDAELERERKDREAAQKRNLVLTEANQKAKRRIQIGAVVLFVAVLGAVISGILAGSRVVEANHLFDEAKNDLKQAQKNTSEEQKKSQQAQEDLAAAQGEIENLGQKARDLEKQQRQKSEELNRANKELVSLTQQRQQAHQDAKDAQLKADKAIKNQAQAQEKTEKARAEANQHLEDAQQAQKQLEKLEIANRNKQEEVNKITAEFKSIGEAHENLSSLASLATRLYQAGKTEQSSEISERVGLDYQVQQELQDHKLTKALLLADISLAYQYLEEWDKAEKAIAESLKELQDKKDIDISDEQWQILVFANSIKGKLLASQNSTSKAREAYREVFDILQTYKSKTNPLELNQTPILTSENVTFVYREYMNLLYKQPAQISQLNKVKTSLKNHYFSQLEDALNKDKKQQWEKADRVTWELILLIANREQERYLDLEAIEKIDCKTLRQIDQEWLDNSNDKLGFSVQARIFKEKLEGVGLDLDRLTIESFKDENTLNASWDAYLRFATEVGWYHEGETSNRNAYGWVVSYRDWRASVGHGGEVNLGNIPKGNLPVGINFRLLPNARSCFSNRVANCNLQSIDTSGVYQTEYVGYFSTRS